MSKTIVTAKYLPATNTLGARWTLKSQHFDKPVRSCYDYGTDGGLSIREIRLQFYAKFIEKYGNLWRNVEIIDVEEVGGPSGSDDERYYLITYEVA